MKTHNRFYFVVFVITLIAVLLPQSTTISAARVTAGGTIPFTEHIIDSDFDMPYSVYATDLDGDNDVDILGAASGDSDISWWENDGNQGFTEHTIASAFSGAHDVYAIDLDGDGDVDVLGAARHADAITWWENDGSENFTEHTISDDFDWAHSVYATDIDGDSDVDILGGAYLDDTIAWWENDGSQNFTEHTIDSNFDGAQYVYATDMDGDGDVDVLGAAEIADAVTWWENDGNESFTEHTIDGDFDAAQSVHPVDLDDDGDIDVLSAAAGADDIAWWENDSDMNFTKHTITDDFDAARSVYATDLDSDGDTDVLGAAYVADTIAWWENDGSESFTKHTITSDFNWAMDVYATDVDGDGDVDVLGAANWADTIAWWEQGLPVELTFLPVVLKNAGPPSSAPELDDISNPDGLSHYDISWSAVSRATSYALEEDDNSDFVSPTTVYDGPNTSTSVSVGEVGTYYYRVRGTNSFGSGPWSNAVSVEVTTIVPGVVPEPGTWDCSTINTTVRFTVSSDSSSVSNGYISISCGSKSIAGPAPIEDSSFTLSHSDGLSFISATFDEESHAEGSFGIWVSDSCWALGTMTCTP